MTRRLDKQENTYLAKADGTGRITTTDGKPLILAVSYQVVEELKTVRPKVTITSNAA